MYLRMARRDLKALEGMLQGEPFADEIFGFHAQQATEKALKAWLCSVGREAPRTHDLQELTDLLREAQQNVPAVFSGLVDLTDFAVTFRYAEMELDADLPRLEMVRVIADLVRHVEELAQEPRG